MYTKFNNLYQEENLNQILLDLLAGYSKINRVGGRQLFCLPTSHTTSTYRSVYGGSLEFNVSFDIFVLD